MKHIHLNMKHTFLRFLSVLFVLTLTLTQVYAVPAYRGWQERSLPDGTPITLRLIGDEFYHFWETEDGKIAVEQEDGTFVVTDKTRPTNQQISTLRKASKMYQSRPRKAIGTRTLAPKGLVILVQFANVEFNAANNATAFDNMLNQEGYSYGGATGSAVDYFKAQSNNTYAPTFDVFGPVTLPNNRVYYGEQGYCSKSGRTENDLYIADFVIDAVTAAEAAGCDFSQYDADNDNYVDIVYFFYAGKGQAAGGSTETIWPHNWELNSALYFEMTHGGSGYTYSNSANKLPKFDNKYINDYVCSAELRSDGSRSGIGTLCHEFSHVLGMPDYYDTEYGENDDNGITPGKWSIMDQGSYNNNEMTPPNYSLYDKYYMGWITEPKLLAKDEKKNVTLTTGYSDGYQISGTTTRRAYNYSSDANPVYYIENRQKTGWDAYLPGSGMIVWKVKYNPTIWGNNEPNNTAGNPRYTIVPADGKTSDYGKASDLFPTGSVNSYTPYTGCALSEITRSGNNITFKYNGGVTKTECEYIFDVENCTASPASGTISINNPLSATVTPNSGYSLDDESCWLVEMGGVLLTYGTDFIYNASNNTFTIPELTDDVYIVASAKLVRTVTWSVNGVTTPVNFADGAALVLPSTPSDCSGDGGKKFVGWTASSSVSGSAPADLFTEAGTKTVTANTTYYAVYATASGSGTGTPEKASSIAVGDQVVLVCEDASMELSGFTTSGTIFGQGTSYSDSGTPSGDYSFTVVDGSEEGSFAFERDTKYWNWSSGNSLSTSTSVSASSSWNVSFEDGNAIIANAGTPARTIQWNASSPRFACYTSAQTAIQLYKIGAGTSYSDYSLTCGAACTNTPSMSFENETVNKTTADASYTQTVTITGKGSGQTVAYSSSDETVATVNSSGVVTLQGKVGSTTITASVEANGTYCAASASYTLNVSAAPINVTLYYNGTSTILNNQTPPYTLPTTGAYVADMCDGDWTFAGWYNNAYDKNTTAPTYITQLTATGSAYAVYTTTENGSGGASGTVTITTSTTNIPTGSYGSANTFTEYTFEGYKFKVQQMYLNSGKLQWRAAGNSSGTGTMYNTQTYPGKISSIVLTYNSSDGNKNFTVKVGNSENPTGGTSITPTNSGLVYTFDCSSENADYFVMTNGTYAGYLDQIQINYGGGGSSTTYYATTPDCSTPPATDYTVTWKACGDTFHTQGFADGAALVLPASTPADNAGKTFVGWTETEHHTGAGAPADLFTTAGSKTVTANVTYYAVFH